VVVFENWSAILVAACLKHGKFARPSLVNNKLEQIFSRRAVLLMAKQGHEVLG
jgi:hypothetical protein